MKKNNILLATNTLFALSLIFVFLTGCTEVVYDNPIDEDGTAYDSDKAQDRDGNDIADISDPNDPNKAKDNIAPEITLNTQYGGAIVDFFVGEPDSKITDILDAKSVVATDNSGIPPMVTISNDPNFSKQIAGSYWVRYTATDGAGNTDSIQRTVNVKIPDAKDTEAPSLIIPPPDTVVVELNDPVNCLNGIISYDAFEKKDYKNLLTFTGKVDSSKAGVYTIQVTTTDNSGNKKTLPRYFRVIDASTTGDPVITLVGATNGEIFTVKKGEPLPVVTATAKDKDGKDITSKITVNKLPDVLEVGRTYTLRFEVVDGIGTDVKTVIYKIISGEGGPVDVTAPVISLKGEATMDWDSGKVWVDPGYTIDDLKATVSVTPKQADVKTNVAPGTIITITYRAIDSSDNEATPKIRKVTIKKVGGTDTEGPVITLKGKNPDSVKVMGTWKDSGCTVMDNVDGKIDPTKVTVDKTALKTSIVGSYEIKYSVKDKAGNIGTATRTVEVYQGAANEPLLEKYGTATAPAMSSLNQEFKTFTLDPPDINAPSLANLTGMKINYDASSKSLYEFSMTFTADPYHKSFTSADNSLSSPKPTVTLVGTKITGLDGEYFVVQKENSLIFVQKDGNFAIIFE